MQNCCAPIVINGGGQREIVEHDRSGLLFSTVEELCAYTLQLIRDEEMRTRLQNGAHERSRRFTRARFEETVKRFFGIIAHEYSTIRLPDPQEIVARSSRSS
jgi:hypothetical protein